VLAFGSKTLVVYLTQSAMFIAAGHYNSVFPGKSIPERTRCKLRISTSLFMCSVTRIQISLQTPHWSRVKLAKNAALMALLKGGSSDYRQVAFRPSILKDHSPRDLKVDVLLRPTCFGNIHMHQGRLKRPAVGSQDA
jgi:hypothetical protein